MTIEKRDLPLVRAVASAGSVHFGFVTAAWQDVTDVSLSYEGTPNVVRAIANALLDTADYADHIAKKFPSLARKDDTLAIEL